MAENTKIQWADSTFNPWRGCEKVSPGCKFCYAARMAARNPAVLGRWGSEGTRVLAADTQWAEPLKWHRNDEGHVHRRRVFCCSLADVFDSWPGQMTDSSTRPLYVNDGTDEAINHPMFHLSNSGIPYSLDCARQRLWRLIRATLGIDWLLLTKHPEDIPRMMPHGEWPNVWLGTSVENQEYTWRMDALMEAAEKIVCPVRFVSAEPLIGELNIRGQLGADSINWLIVGGESGAIRDVRYLRLEWVLSLIAQCDCAKVPIFVKQLGRNPVGIHLEDLHGGDELEWPGIMRRRDFPELDDDGLF